MLYLCLSNDFLEIIYCYNLLTRRPSSNKKNFGTNENPICLLFKFGAIGLVVNFWSRLDIEIKRKIGEKVWRFSITPKCSRWENHRASLSFKLLERSRPRPGKRWRVFVARLYTHMSGHKGSRPW